jgi:deazaflavin-dependent oxidoreductase (nitroreductase family)
MPLSGEYEPSPSDWVREQVEEYEASGGTRANTLRETGLPVVVLTYLGNRSGKLRKTAVMRVEHDGTYALVASKGGNPNHPGWYHCLVSDPRIELQDGPEPHDYAVRELEGPERQEWWDRSVAVFPDYAEYQTRTDRVIPVFLAEPV